MNTIGIIDDRNNQRESIKIAITHSLESLEINWKVIDSNPFSTVEEYRDWVLENEISVLVIDEKLNEEKGKDGGISDHYGHEVIVELKKNLKDLPIYVLTSFGVSDELKQTMTQYNMVILRSEFEDDIDKYTNLFVASGKVFYNENKKQLEKLGELSDKIAKGKASPEEINEAKGIQTTLAIKHYTDDIVSKEEYLTELERKINDLNTLNNKIEEYIDKNK